MQRVVEVVVPLPLIGAAQPPHLVAFVLQHQVRVRGHRTYLVGKLLQETVIVNGVHRIQAQSVDAIVAQPHQRIVDEEPPHPGLAEVDGLAPRRAAIVTEEPARVVAQTVPLRPEVVVDHIQQHREPCIVCRVDKGLQRGRTAIGQRGCIREHAVVAPVAATGKLRDRHQFNGGDAQGRQHRQLRGQRREPAAGLDVHFIGHQVLPGMPLPRGMCSIRAKHHRAVTIDAVRLPARGRVGHVLTGRQAEPVAVTMRRLCPQPVAAVRVAVHRPQHALQVQRHGACVRCPHAELDTFTGHRPCAQARRHCGHASTCRYSVDSGGRVSRSDCA